MARKPKAKQPPAPAAPQGTYGEWRKHMAALPERKRLSPSVRLERAWRNAFISGETPKQAADRAKVEARNTRTTFDGANRANLSRASGLSATAAYDSPRRPPAG